LVVSVVKTDATCDAGKDGTIQVIVKGGSGNYKYKLNNGAYKTSPVFGMLRSGDYTVTVKDDRNCETTASVTIEKGTGTCPDGPYTAIPDSLNGGSLKIIAFPNPSPTEFTLVIQGGSGEKVQVMVTDMSGKRVYQVKGNPARQYTFGREFASGMYILQVMQGGEIKTLKLIKTQ